MLLWTYPQAGGGKEGRDIRHQSGKPELSEADESQAVLYDNRGRGQRKASFSSGLC